MPEVIADELEKGPEPVKSVSLTGAENLQMFMGDPESAETKAIMEAHGINFGDSIIVNVEGQKSMVVLASENDFWTRDKAATEAISTMSDVSEPQPTELHETAAVAKMMMGETAPDNVETHEELVAEAIEPLGKESLEETMVNADTFNGEEEAPVAEVAIEELTVEQAPIIEDKAETLAPLDKAEIVAMIEKNRKDLEYRLESYKAQAGYSEADHGGRSVLGKASELLDELMRSGEPRTPQEKEEMSQLLSQIARDLDNNIVGAYEPFDKRGWEKAKTEHLAEPEDGDLSELSKLVGELTVQLDTAHNESRKVKSLAAGISSQLKGNVSLALANGWTVGDQLYAVIAQLKRQSGIEDGPRESVANIQSTLKSIEDLAA